MRKRTLSGVFLGILVGSLILPIPVGAAPGTPNSLAFGYGARINVDGIHAPLALRMAAGMRIDWVALDFDWAASQPEAGAWNENDSFTQAMLLCRTLGLDVLISISDAPAWAMTPGGPQAESVSVLVNTLAEKYPHLLAVEPFPGANTRAGWGAAPNPAAYAEMLQTVEAGLAAELYIVSAGLENRVSAPEDIRDLDFLQGLYDAGWKGSILSIRLDALQGDLLELPAQDRLRHYEQIRALMNENQHSDGLIWVTSLGLPNDTNDESWLLQAYEQLQAQLYMGAVFYESFNPCGACEKSLIDEAGTPGPEYLALLEAISLRKDVPAPEDAQAVADRIKQMAKHQG